METDRLEVGKYKIYLEQFMNEVTVMAEDEKGMEWFICTLRKDEPLLLHSALPPNFYLPTDEEGHVETSEEY